MGRLFRVILFLFALPVVLLLVLVGLFVKPRQRDEEAPEEEALVVTAEEELEDAELEESEADKIRRWMADASPTRRGKLIRMGYSRQRFLPQLPWLRSARKS